MKGVASQSGYAIAGAVFLLGSVVLGCQQEVCRDRLRIALSPPLSQSEWHEVVVETPEQRISCRLSPPDAANPSSCSFLVGAEEIRFERIAARVHSLTIFGTPARVTVDIRTASRHRTFTIEPSYDVGNRRALSGCAEYLEAASPDNAVERK